jgi:inner membrane protein
MPSTIVHLALAGLIAAALLGEQFDRRALAVVLVVVAVPDLDSFILFTQAGHRTVLHNATIPVLGMVVLYLDVRGDSSVLRGRYGEWGVRVAWVSLLCYLLAGVMLDVADGYVNLFWPLYDQFYTLDGVIELSDQRGLVQTFTDSGLPLLDARGTSGDTEITTGIDPGEGESERVFPIVRSGWEVVVVLVGTLVTGLRAYRDE